MQKAYINDYYEKMSNFIRSLFASALKDNIYAYKAILTGCLRISKESIFTGLNNFNIYSILEEKSSQYFRFDQLETQELLNYYNLNEY